MANARVTKFKKENTLRSKENIPVRASVRFWKKIAGADLPWDSTAVHQGIPCDAIQLDADGAFVTGIPGSQAVGTTPVVGPPCAANGLYPHSWYTITAISGGNVWLGWFEDPTVTTAG